MRQPYGFASLTLTTHTHTALPYTFTVYWRFVCVFFSLLLSVVCFPFIRSYTHVYVAVAILLLTDHLVVSRPSDAVA